MAIVRLLTVVSVLALVASPGAQPAAKNVKTTPSPKHAMAKKPQGAQLIAHELTHVIQQAAAQPAPKMNAAEKKALALVTAKIRAGDSKAAADAWRGFIAGWTKVHGTAGLEAIENELIADAMGPKAQQFRRTEIAVRQLDAHIRTLRGKLQKAKAAPVSVRPLAWNEKKAALTVGRTTKLSQSQIDAKIEEMEALAELVRNKRQMASTAFQNFDQKANQQYNLLSSIMKAVRDARMDAIRNML